MWRAAGLSATRTVHASCTRLQAIAREGEVSPMSHEWFRLNTRQMSVHGARFREAAGDLMVRQARGFVGIGRVSAGSAALFATSSC